eukprot:TRINITY_DN43713_c0_g1_i1.p1 TRINITY_DN43713_c0_g1~~TRINITY_DN43713_c0_g1_i1.p1  ORF type:complete len:573 (-),score=158.02 TRINITY_DN43713_c0_g1_i1:232-1872(-)
MTAPPWDRQQLLAPCTRVSSWLLLSTALLSSLPGATGVESQLSATFFGGSSEAASCGDGFGLESLVATDRSCPSAAMQSRGASLLQNVRRIGALSSPTEQQEAEAATQVAGVAATATLAAAAASRAAEDAKEAADAVQKLEAAAGGGDAAGGAEAESSVAARAALEATARAALAAEAAADASAMAAKAEASTPPTAGEGQGTVAMAGHAGGPASAASQLQLQGLVMLEAELGAVHSRLKDLRATATVLGASRYGSWSSLLICLAIAVAAGVCLMAMSMSGAGGRDSKSSSGQATEPIAVDRAAPKASGAFLLDPSSLVGQGTSAVARASTPASPPPPGGALPLCPEFVVPELHECAFVVPEHFLQSGYTGKATEATACTEDGSAVFRARLGKRPLDLPGDLQCLLLSSAGSDATFAFARKREGKSGLLLYHRSDRLYGMLDKENGVYRLQSSQGHKIFFNAGEEAQMHAKTSDGKLLAIVEAIPFQDLDATPPAESGGGRKITIGPSVDAGLIMLCLLGIDWIEQQKPAAAAASGPSGMPSGSSGP